MELGLGLGVDTGGERLAHEQGAQDLLPLVLLWQVDE